MGLGRAEDRPTTRRGAVPPGLVARPLPDRHRAARDRRHAPRPTARSTSCSTPSRSPTARSRRTRRSTARRVGRPAARRGRVPDRARRSSAAPTARPGRTSRKRRRLPRRPTGPRPRRSAGRTSPATRRRRSRPRSPAWSAPPTSRARTVTTRAAATLPGDGRRVAAQVERWTATTQRPARTQPYYLRLTKDGQPDTGTTYSIGDGGPRRRPAQVVDPSFLELVRFGVNRRRRPGDRSTPSRRRPVARRRHPERHVLAPLHLRRLRRASRRRRRGIFPIPDTGNPWPGLAAPRRRARRVRPRWPASRRTAPRLGDGRARPTPADMLPEQVWDGRKPTGTHGFKAGEPRSARRLWPGHTHSSCGSRGRSRHTPRSSVQRSWPIAIRPPLPKRYPSSPTSRRSGVFLCPPAHSRTPTSRSTPSMARGDVRIAVTLACEDCKRRNYQTNKSKRNNPDRITLRKYCNWCRRHTGIAKRDKGRPERWPPTVHAAEATATPMHSAPTIVCATTTSNATTAVPSRPIRSVSRCRT